MTRISTSLSGWLCGAAAVLVLALSSCAEPSSTSEETAAQPTPEPDPDETLLPAVADRPKTAAACEGPSNGPVGMVEVNPDTPAPRCLSARPDQGLKVVNTTARFGQPGKPVVVTFGPWSAHRLEPGESVTFKQPVGQVFAPGIHDLVLDVGGLHWDTEIWVQDEASDPEPAGSGAPIRVLVPSHCGVLSVHINGVLWLADPPLGDHNPPAGWDENRTPGYVLLTGPTTATFHGDDGQTARFARPPAGSTDPAAGCE